MIITKESHLVSIIVPIYNAEKYLKECLDSIITQSYPYIEIVCVNDGSTDSSAQIIEEYRQKDERIVVVTQENKGLSAARNIGMEKASGNYIMFVDSDDFIEVNMVEVMLKNLLTHNSDFVIESIWVYNDKTQSRTIQEDAYFSMALLSPNLNNRAFTYKEVLHCLFQVPVMAWGKLYKADFLKSTGAKFPEGLIYEDNLFFYDILFKAQRVSIDRRQLYNYRINVSDSIMNKPSTHYADMIEIMRRIEKLLKAQPFYNEIKENFMIYKIVSIIKTIITVPKKYRRKYFYQIQKELLNMEMVYCIEAELSKLPFYPLYCCLRNDKYWQFCLKSIISKINAQKNIIPQIENQ